MTEIIKRQELQKDILKLKIRNVILLFMVIALQLIFLESTLKKGANKILVISLNFVIAILIIYGVFIITKWNIKNMIKIKNLRYQEYIKNENLFILRQNEDVLDYRVRKLSKANMFDVLKIDDWHEHYFNYKEKDIENNEVNLERLKIVLKNQFEVILVKAKEFKNTIECLVEKELIYLSRIDEVIEKLENIYNDTFNSNRKDELVYESVKDLLDEFDAIENTYNSVILSLKPRIEINV